MAAATANESVAVADEAVGPALLPRLTRLHPGGLHEYFIFFRIWMLTEVKTTGRVLSRWCVYTHVNWGKIDATEEPRRAASDSQQCISKALSVRWSFDIHPKCNSIWPACGSAALQTPKSKRWILHPVSCTFHAGQAAKKQSSEDGQGISKHIYSLRSKL